MIRNILMLRYKRKPKACLLQMRMIWRPHRNISRKRGEQMTSANTTLNFFNLKNHMISTFVAPLP